MSNDFDEEIPEIYDEASDEELTGDFSGIESDKEDEFSDDGSEANEVENDDDASDTSSIDSDDYPSNQNKVGRINLEWYNDFPHIGYDLDGKKIMRPARGDELDKFLDKMDDPKYWKTVHDKIDDKDIVLTSEELKIIDRIQKGYYADENFDPYQDSVDFFTKDVSIHPVTNAPEPKSRFVPSKWEAKRIFKIVRAIRRGWIIPNKPKQEKPKVYDLWASDDIQTHRASGYLAAPKQKLPTHSESFNPPEEYLLSKEEEKEWEEQDSTDRSTNYLPRKYKAMRLIPAYSRIIQERFERCLDLYLCPRVKKNRIDIDPESLIPKLPDPKSLLPFPTKLAITYKGHSDKIRSFSIDPTGQYIVSGSDDKTVRLWELLTGRCLNTWYFDHIIQQVSWNPNKKMSLFSVIYDNKVLFINPSVASNSIIDKTDQFLLDSLGKSTSSCEWSRVSDDRFKDLERIEVIHKSAIYNFQWQIKGDYFTTNIKGSSGNSIVLIHQISKKSSQNPFKNFGGLVQKMMFHPTKPMFFVATQRMIKLYDLVKQELVKSLVPNVKWISSFDIHPNGDNVLVGSYDKKCCWIDMDLSNSPYKTLRFHEYAIRTVTFHKKYPIFATCSDDGNVHIVHGMVYQDLLQNPLIVPVKILPAHEKVNGLGSLSCEFHPTQPWIVSSGSDAKLCLFT